jgi:putative 4-mercaptohistidine N1-methyltranferase
MNIYETDQLLAQYLLFHYGAAEEILPYPSAPREALDYPVRCITECLDASRLPSSARALDLGCAVGRSTFELARSCHSVIGIDFSHRFIDAAEALRQTGALSHLRLDEGDLTTPLIARVAPEIPRERVRFLQGDAMALPEDLGPFDVVLMANLIDRLSSPLRCLARLSELVAPGGQLIITSPYTWLEDFTPRERWLGGFQRNGQNVTTLDGLTAALTPAFTLEKVQDLPFLIREHARKYQWSVAQATRWVRQ